MTSRLVRPPAFAAAWCRALGCGAALLLSGLPGRGQGLPDYELAPIEYSARQATNRISSFHARHPGIPPGLRESSLLRWFLEQNDVPVDSQVLVFSRTSLQRDLIRPRRPRALYFNDDLYIGWVPGGLMEVAVTDPELGLAFYHVEGRDPARGLVVQRDADCLSCHGGSMTRNWPGLMVRSVFPDESGSPISAGGSFLVGHDTPLEQRWGGWYVTGRHGDARHLGNMIAQASADARQATLDREAGANRTNLVGLFDATPYLRGDSDIVALMVLEHQIQVHNRLCEGGLRVRHWTHYQRQLQKELGEPMGEELVGTALRVLQSETERIVEALLFTDEIPLPEGGIQGAGDFERQFLGRRQPDPGGRSLRDFDLQQRLFRYRCSYMVYSAAFATLPAPLRQSVLRRLDAILSAAEPPAKYARLPAAERSAIREILRATLPAYSAAVGTTGKS